MTSLILCAIFCAQPQLVNIEARGGTRTLAIHDGRLYTESIHNAVAGRTIRIRGPEFVIACADGQLVTSDSFRVTGHDFDGATTSVTLEHSALSLRAVISYTVASSFPGMYKQIRFENTGAASILLRAVDVEHLSLVDESITYTVDPAFPTMGDWGQPVYGESLWFGLEFPAARSAAARDGVIVLRHHPGLELAPGASYTGKRAALGFSETSEVQHAFFEYASTLGPHAGPPRANIYWNGFRVVKPPNRLPQGLAMIEYARIMKEQTGFRFDGWTYDAGFDMYRPDALFVPNEADIWDKTREALKPLDTPLGFWTSFSPIFDTPTHAWGRTQGFELQHDSAYCLAGPVYFKAIKSRLETIVRDYGMNTVNFDGMYWGQGFGCNQPGHGHLVGTGSEAGVYATERVAENKLDIFASLRAINPDIVLDLFVCNEWASPWWLAQLDGVHTVAGDTLGCDIPSPWLRDELITVRDIQVFDGHRRLRRQFPLWAEDLYGNQVRRDHLIDGVVVTGESMAARWQDEFTLALAGRGAVQNHIVCCDLEVLHNSAGGLKFLGDACNWVKRNAPIYRNFRLIGGEPAKRQPYGYTHGDKNGRSIVALRNPWIEPRIYLLMLDDSLDLGAHDGPVEVTIVYPHRETLGTFEFGRSAPISLPDYAVMLLEVRAPSRKIGDDRFRGRWSVDGDRVSLLDATPLERGPSGRFVASRQTNSLQFSGAVSVPPGATGQIQLMLLPKHSAVPDVRATINGVAAVPALHHRQRDAKADAWALLDLPEGESTVELELVGSGLGRVGAWLIANYTLPVIETIQHDVGDLFPVCDDRSARLVTTLFAPADYALPLPPLPDAPQVSLGDLKNRCVSAQVGFFHVGWNASCWDEDPTLRVGEATFNKGVGVHAPSELVFDIDGAFKTFSAEIGMHGVPAARKAKDAQPGSSAFIVEGDGKQLFTSRVIKEQEPPVHIEVDVRGVRRLTLRTTNGGDSNFDDLGTWGNALLVR